MEIAGYFAAALIGISLGLIGGGGSILTVPVLVYLFAISPATAISYSLLIVGFTSLTGAAINYIRGNVNLKIAMLFGASSITTVFLVRKFVVPALPDVFFTIGNFQVTQSLLLMVVFAVLMLAASYSMIKSRTIEAEQQARAKPLVLLLYGFLIGLVTGLLGAGGGFLLIPALVFFMKLPMKKAIGTSLFIIALNSLIGFAGDIGQHIINWKFLLTITGIAVGGIFIGSYFAQKVDGKKLKKGFGWFVLMMGVYIIIREIFFNS